MNLHVQKMKDKKWEYSV